MQWCSIIIRERGISFHPANSKYIQISDSYKVIIQREKRNDYNFLERRIFVSRSEPHLRETTSPAQGTDHLAVSPYTRGGVFTFNLLLEKNVIWTYLHGAITWNIYWGSLCQRIWEPSKEQGEKNTPLLSTSAASQVTPRTARSCAPLRCAKFTTGKEGGSEGQLCVIFTLN